jgi:hypothetical protein
MLQDRTFLAVPRFSTRAAGQRQTTDEQSGLKYKKSVAALDIHQSYKNKCCVTTAKAGRRDAHKLGSLLEIRFMSGRSAGK